MNERMFCRQCEQAAKGKACTSLGICGKNPQAAALMDKIIYVLQGIAIYGNRLRENGIVFDQVNEFIIEALFSTVTNVNFDPERLRKILKDGLSHLENIKNEFIKVYPEFDISKLPEPALIKHD